MSNFFKYLTADKRINRSVAIFAIILAFLIGAVVMMITGADPIEALKAIIRSITGINLNKIGSPAFFKPRLIGEFITTLMPIILTGLSVAFAFRTGLFNIGAEGQFIMGGMAAVCIGVLFDLPKIIHLPFVVLGAILAGALWGMIPGYLKARFNVHEVVVTIMLNYTALYLSNLIFKSLPGSTSVKTVPVAESANFRSDFLRTITDGSRLHWGFILVILSVIAFWYILEKTTFGYELKAVGFNREAARYAGMKVNRNIVLSMAIAGAFAGLAGAMIAVGTFDYGRVISSVEGYGFDGIAVALLGGNTALGTVFGGLLFGGLKQSQKLMQVSGIPQEIAIIISSLMVLFIAMKVGLQDVLVKLAGRLDKED